MAQGFARALKKILHDEGWVFHRQGKGSHEVWIGPQGRKVTLPANVKRRATANDVLKQAGIDKKL